MPGTSGGSWQAAYFGIVFGGTVRGACNYSALPHIQQLRTIDNISSPLSTGLTELAMELETSVTLCFIKSIWTVVAQDTTTKKTG